MTKGIFTAAAGMLPRVTQLEVLSNNLANLNTTGYKGDVIHFRRLLDARLVFEQGQSATPAEEILTHFEQGSLEATHNPLDFALQGDGFFVVKTDHGLRYTRNGHFALSSEGFLVTEDGHAVQGEKGNIFLTDLDDLTVDASGGLWVNGVLLDRFSLVDFAKPYPLAKEGQTLFRLTDPNAVAAPAESIEVKQGFLENTNVEALREMVDLIQLLREFEADQRAIQYQDETLGKAVNEVGRVA